MIRGLLVKSLCKPRLHIQEMEIQLHLFLTLALDGGEWLASRTGSFISREGTSPPPPPRYALSRRLGGPQSQSRRFWRTENCRAMPGF
jgi:hypothetical protein